MRTIQKCLQLRTLFSFSTATLSTAFIIATTLSQQAEAAAPPTANEATITQSVNDAEPNGPIVGVTKRIYQIVIDPGHGGYDTGASNNGTHESAIALAISKQVSAKLQKDGYKVILTRSKDEWVSLEKRAAIANEAVADLFVSIHLNSSPDTRAQGKEFYFQNQLAVDEESLFLANRENHEHEDPNALSQNPGQDRIQKSGLRLAEAAKLPPLNIANPGVKTDVRNILEDLDRSARVRSSSELAKILHQEWERDPASRASAGHASARGIRQAPFFLVSNVAMPSVLVEVGFLSHAKEGARLQTPEYQTALATALASGIDHYFKRP